VSVAAGPLPADRHRRPTAALGPSPTVDAWLPPPLQPPHGELPHLAIVVLHHRPLVTPRPTLVLQDPLKLIADHWSLTPPRNVAEPPLQATSPSPHWNSEPRSAWHCQAGPPCRTGAHATFPAPPHPTASRLSHATAWTAHAGAPCRAGRSGHPGRIVFGPGQQCQASG
jgi:hypothetical protein